MSDDNNGDFLSPMVHFGVYRDIPESEWILSTYKEEILMEEDESRCPNCGSMHYVMHEDDEYWYLKKCTDCGKVWDFVWGMKDRAKYRLDDEEEDEEQE